MTDDLTEDRLVDSARLIELYLIEAFPDEEESTKVAVRFLLWSTVLGPDEKAIGQLLSLPEEKSATFGARAREQGIWVGDKVHAEWLDEEEGWMAVLLDAMVLLGLLERSK